LATRAKIFILLISISHALFLNGQSEVVRYPVRFSQYYNSYPLLNPSAIGSLSKIELSFGNKRLLGNFSNISTYYFNANLRISPKKGINKPFSALGVLFYNDREGKYLNRSRFYLIYAWHGNLSQKIKFSGGFQIGGFNYAVKGTPLSGDGSDLKPDAAVGLQIYNSNFHVGISVNQVFNSKVQPLEEITILAPYLNITGDWKYKISEPLLFVPNFAVFIPLSAYEKNANKVLVDFNLNLTINQILFVSAGLHNNDMINISAGLGDILSSEKKLNIQLTYTFPFAKRTNLNTGFLEIGLGYFF
jgi:type IX secretion system PorP/SprF family membrane protein